MKKKLSALVAGAMMTGAAFAADGIKTNVAVDVSVYHSDNFTKVAGEGQKIQGLNADRGDVDVNQASLTLSGSNKDLDWLFEANLAGEDAIGTYVQQAYLTLNVNENFSVSAGRMNSFFGFEAAAAKSNWNYTHSYAFLASPLWNEGVSAKFDAKNGMTATLYSLDRTSNNSDVKNENDGNRSVGLSIGYSMDKFAAKLDYFRTKESSYDDWANLYNLNATYDISDSFAVGADVAMSKVNATATNEQKWSSYAAYAKFKATEKFFAAARYEMFEEKRSNNAEAFGFVSNTANNYSVADLVGHDTNGIDSITLTLGYDLMNGSEMKLDYRMDSADQKIWTDGSDTKDSVNVVALAWLFNY